MRKNIFKASIPLLFCFIFLHTQASPDPISQRLDLCLTQSYSTPDIVRCHYEAAQEWDKVLNILYKKIMNELPDKKLKSSLKKIQKNWIVNLAAQETFMMKLSQNMGTIQSIIRANLNMAFIKNRALELLEIYNSIFHLEKVLEIPDIYNPS